MRSGAGLDRMLAIGSFGSRDLPTFPLPPPRMAFALSVIFLWAVAHSSRQRMVRWSLLSNDQRTIRWRELCATAHRKITERAKAIRGGGSGKVGKSRDPKEPIASILSSPAPLRILLQFIFDLESSPPPLLHHRDYVVWIRDVLFSKLIASNPLRASQFALITYLNNNRGNLYQAV